MIIDDFIHDWNRHEWYQTNSHVIVTVFAKNVPKESTVCTFKENSVKDFFFSQKKPYLLFGTKKQI